MYLKDKVTMVIFGLMTLTAANPVRNSREASPPSESITVILTPQTDSGIAEKISGLTLRECIPVPNSHIPTQVKVESDPESYKMVGFPEVCARRDESKGVPIHFPIINQRTPICSFKLGISSLKLVTVRFSSGVTQNGVIHHNVDLKDSQLCLNICDSPTDSWAKYAQKVELLRNGKEVNNHIQIFSDSGCQVKISEVEINQNVNLPAETRPKGEPELKSFTVLRK